MVRILGFSIAKILLFTGLNTRTWQEYFEVWVDTTSALSTASYNHKETPSRIYVRVLLFFSEYSETSESFKRK